MNKKRFLYFDILNIIAIISVIAMHCNGIVHGAPNSRAWYTSLVVECICYFAVPLFIMISGANLMNYREKYDTKTFFKKRLSKVIIPFIFWVIVMFIWKIYIIHSIDKPTSIQGLLNDFFVNKEEPTYYFVWSIIGVYLTMPFLSLVASEKNKKSLWTVVILYFIFNAFVPNILKLVGINYNLDASVQFAGYIIFVILGYLLSKENVARKYRICIYVGALIGIIYRYITTIILSENATQVIKTTWGYTSWHSILLASAVFLIIKNIEFKKNETRDAITRKIAGCSYAIFLIHQIVMYYEKSIFSINTASWQWRTVGVITTYLISLWGVLLLKKIPLIKKIVS